MTVSTHNATVTLIPATAMPMALDWEKLDVTLDESWSPFVQGTLVIPLPSAVNVDKFDPRTHARLTIGLVQTFGDVDTIAAISAQFAGGHLSNISAAYPAGKHLADITKDHYRAFNSFGVRPTTRLNLSVSIRARVIDHEANTLTVTFASDEALLQDYALVDNQAYLPPTLFVRSLVLIVLNRIGAVLLPGTADGIVAAGSNEWTPGQSAWDYLAPLVQQAALRLWCDNKRSWHLEADTYTEPGLLSLSDVGTITSGEDTISRDGEWFDAVVITYRWTDDAGASHTAYDSASSGTYSKVKPLTYDDTIYPGPGAAARVLNRRLALGRQQTVQAVSDYSALPSQAVSISMPDTPTQTGFVKSVHFGLDATGDTSDEMNIETRGLTETSPYAWSAAVGSWASKPVGMHWNTYTP